MLRRINEKVNMPTFCQLPPCRFAYHTEARTCRWRPVPNRRL